MGQPYEYQFEEVVFNDLFYEATLTDHFDEVVFNDEDQVFKAYNLDYNSDYN
jgi:hypothetical protein